MIYMEFPKKWLSQNNLIFTQSILEAMSPTDSAYRPFESISQRWEGLLKKGSTESETGAFSFSSDESGFSLTCALEPVINRPYLSTVCSETTVNRWSRSRQRVARELQLLDWAGVDGISLYTEDLDTIHCFIAGPVDSPYEGYLYNSIR